MGSKKWGIVGGGIMGMTLAHQLAQLGHKVSLFEAAPNLGGLVSSWKMGDVEWDKFYHVILLSDFRTRNLLKEIGLEDKIEWVETKTGFYIDGKLYSMSDTIEFLKFPALNWIDKFRLGLTIIVASKIKNWKRLENIPVTTWLKKWSGKKTFEKIWLPLLRAKLGESYQKTSAVFIWATIQRLYGARKSGLKKEMFGYVPGGYKRIIEAYKENLIREGIRIRTNCAASEVRIAANGKPEIYFADAVIEEFDEVIVTLPSGMASQLCKGLTGAEIDKLNNIEYLGVICVAVLLDKSVSPFYITNITDSSVPFTGVIEMSALVDKKYLDGHSLLYLPKYVSPDDPIFKKPDEEIRNYFMENFKKMYPWITDENIQFAGVAKAKHVITVAKLNYSDMLPEIRTSLPGVSIINTSHIKDGTLNVNETVRVAETKLKELLM
ncbi:MAG TPA: NAD(P)/FAD-dependent oxidoreductase [Chitinophagaceae bacterium]|nr:NAD(P)/FAD-dependent oxidoreductase [Chitinophagaceae bacterium]